jgi:hypothetical protein
MIIDIAIDIFAIIELIRHFHYAAASAIFAITTPPPLTDTHFHWLIDIDIDFQDTPH